MFGRRRNGRDFQAHLGAVVADLDALKKDVRRLANGASDYASVHAGDAIKTVQHTADDVFEQVDEFRDTVRGLPLTACIVSLGIGAVLAALLTARR